MNRLIDLTGARFGYLLVEQYEGRNARGRTVWRCLCDCGKRRVIPATRLRSGQSKSCGCRRAEFVSLSRTKHGHARPGAITPEYTSWKSMIRRCEERSNVNYANYGGRGIRVCERWRLSFEAFLADMGLRPSSRHSIDRIDNHGDYCPENCRWASTGVQSVNRRNNRRLSFAGESLTMTEWARRLRMGPSTLARRLHLGWDVERALTEPVRKPALEAQSALDGLIAALRARGGGR